MSRTVLITGASRGLGATLAEVTAGPDVRSILTGRDERALDASARRLEPLGGEVVPVRGDVADPEHRHALAAAVGERLDVLFLNASTLGPSPLPRLSSLRDDDLRAVLETNLVAQLALTRVLLPALRTGDGLAVHVSSDAAHGAYEGWGAYGTSKLALELIARTWAAEEPLLNPVIVDPGDMRTAMHQAAFPGEDVSDRPLPAETAPFWRWLLAQDPRVLRGRRFRAQAEVWDDPVAASDRFEGTPA